MTLGKAKTLAIFEGWRGEESLAPPLATALNIRDM